MDTTKPLFDNHNKDTSKQTHQHELALCHDVTLDIMTDPCVPVDTHSTQVPEIGLNLYHAPG